MSTSKRKAAGPEDELSRLVERDLTALAREGRLAAAHGVDELVAEVLGLLARGDKHPLLAGEPGVGKSAAVHEVARRIASGAAGADLAASRLVEVSMAGILARGERRAAETLDELLEALARTPRSIVYVRDLAAGIGGPVIPVMIKALRAAELRFVLESDPRRANDLLRSDDAVAERLHLLVVPEPPPERARSILGKVADDLERELSVPIDPAAADMAFRLAGKFLLAQRMPRKAIELLRETAAEASNASRDHVAAEDVLARFCAATRLPRFVVNDAMPLDLAETERFFGERILGQADAVAAVLRSVALLKAGLNDPLRPLGVFLFAGPTGVGKTHLAKLLAEFLFGSADRLVRLNMADYPDLATSRCSSAPPGRRRSRAAPRRAHPAARREGVHRAPARRVREGARQVPRPLPAALRRGPVHQRGGRDGALQQHPHHRHLERGRRGLPRGADRLLRAAR